MKPTVKVKICGNTNLDDARLAKDLGADFLGFIFAKSKRQISTEQAAAILSALRPFENFVAVFANQSKEEVERIAGKLNLKWLQFHGDETSRYCDHFTKQGLQIIKTFRIKDKLSFKRIDEYNVSAYLFDTYSEGPLGGTGETFDWSLIDDKPYIRERLFLAGGLNLQNVEAAIRTVKPYAIDVASGVEKSPGVKDPSLLEKFIRLAKGKASR